MQRQQTQHDQSSPTHSERREITLQNEAGCRPALASDVPPRSGHLGLHAQPSDRGYQPAGPDTAATLGRTEVAAVAGSTSVLRRAIKHLAVLEKLDLPLQKDLFTPRVSVAGDWEKSRVCTDPAPSVSECVEHSLTMLSAQTSCHMPPQVS